MSFPAICDLEASVLRCGKLQRSLMAPFFAEWAGRGIYRIFSDHYPKKGLKRPKTVDII